MVGMEQLALIVLELALAIPYELDSNAILKPKCTGQTSKDPFPLPSPHSTLPQHPSHSAPFSNHLDRWLSPLLNRNIHKLALLLHEPIPILCQPASSFCSPRKRCASIRSV